MNGLIVPEFRPDHPVEERPDRPPGLDHLAGRVMKLDRLAAEDVLDLLAGHRVQRLDPPGVHHGQLADLFIGGAFAQDPGLRLGLAAAGGKAGAEIRPPRRFPDREQD